VSGTRRCQSPERSGAGRARKRVRRGVVDAAHGAAQAGLTGGTERSSRLRLNECERGQKDQLCCYLELGFERAGFFTGRSADAATRKKVRISGRDPEESRVGIWCRKNKKPNGYPQRVNAQGASTLESDTIAESCKHSASQLCSSYSAGSLKVLSQSLPQAFRCSRAVVAILRYSKLHAPVFTCHAQSSLFEHTSPHCQ